MGEQPDKAAAEELPPEGFGAAEASLTDPSCVPGQEAFKKAKAYNDSLLAQYQARKQHIESQGVSAAAPCCWCRVGAWLTNNVAVGDTSTGLGAWQGSTLALRRSVQWRRMPSPTTAAATSSPPRAQDMQRMSLLHRSACCLPACLQGRKPDMTAAKNIRDGLGADARAGVYGHVPGVQVGDEFDGRGELSVLGLHIQVRREGLGPQASLDS